MEPDVLKRARPDPFGLSGNGDTDDDVYPCSLCSCLINDEVGLGGEGPDGKPVCDICANPDTWKGED